MTQRSSLSLALAAILLLLTARASAQTSFDDRYTFSKGFTALTDFTKSPSFPNQDSTQVLHVNGFSLLSYTINPRLNLYAFSERSSVSVETPISLSLHISPLGVGAVNVPVILAYNYGTVATHYSGMSKGFSAGLGLEYTQVGLVKFKPEEGIVPKYSWMQPVMVMGYRYRTKRYKAKEINLKVGYGEAERVALKPTDALPHSGNSSVANRTMSLKLSFVRYINY
ncbi:hypothetical protein BH24BAC1_BH24BAC1_17950 [soil metagenome]|jgi:hypothetical protein